jgi:hypothetical protein
MSTKTGPAPCRLSVILAREAPVGVIFRRGPSRHVELIKWHTDTDAFERGQWFKGRIDEYYADLSPDGSHLVYHAAKQVIWESWTAISRPPWLTAVAFWPGTGSAAYFGVWGGGLFLDNQTVWISPHSVKLSSPEVRQPTELVVRTEPSYYIYTTRLERSGWRAKPDIQTHIYEKDEPLGTRTMVEACRKCYDHLRIDRYTLIDRQSGREIPIQEAFWADWDQQGRLVFTRHGKVFAGGFDDQGQVVARELADFNADSFELRKAPAWAREW